MAGKTKQLRGFKQKNKHKSGDEEKISSRKESANTRCKHTHTENPACTHMYQ